MNIKNKTKKRAFRLPGKAAMLMLNICLPLISAALIALTVRFSSEASASPATALVTYPDMYSYISAAIILLILGGILADLSERERQNK